MSLEEAAKIVADQIRRQQFVEVYAHHDADGIAAGAILCNAMLRAGIRFRLRVCADIPAEGLSHDAATLLCDLGSGKEDLPLETIVVDHHLPLFGGQFHANPRLEKIDGDRELSAAGMAYIVAQEMGDNRDLAGLVIPGIIGDGQAFAGKNLEIFNEGVANGILVPDKGMTLAGRDMAERWVLATRPYLEGISGCDSAVADLLAPAQGDNGLKTDILLSLAVLTAAPQTSADGLGLLYGDTIHLQREVIEDAHALTAVIDACGKSGHGDLAVALCLRSSVEIEQAWEVTRRHHLNVIGALGKVQPAEEGTAVYECSDAMLASDIADVLARDRVQQAPVLVYARYGEDCRISARLPRGVTADLGPLVRTLAATCGGNGGGHHTRAGATIPCDRLGAFVKGWHERLAA
ncbi:DHHA1 domain-containing protein [Methanoregula sp.]|uniref:DHHA1 domain-containing protein n=1 Tax=Methanoregula sp. TaxID=2052170 RepID=UPI002C24FD9D|nr:DHHA1 domain-containing protein [Methanoregula sp.]HVP97469.1 DHHA1 domain-containing protein [Methanoregula sp.]